MTATIRREARKRHDGHFDERLRRLRFQQGLSQREISASAKVPYTTYREWESGRSVPHPGEPLRSLASILRVSVPYLLFGDEEEK